MASAQPALLEVQHQGDRLVTHDGAIVLDQLPAGARVRPEECGAGAVLGLALAPGSEPTACADFCLGQVSASRFLALGRTSLWWMAPAWGGSMQQLPEETQFLLLELSAGAGYALLLPLIDGGTFRATLRPGSPSQGAGSLMLRIESGSADVAAASWPSALLVATGHDPYDLIDTAVAAAARLSGTSKPRSEKEVPPSADVFGFCTWDAFYSRVSAAGIQQGLESLADGGVPPKLLIIDDGWQRTDVDQQFRQAAAAGCPHAVGAVPGVGIGSSVHEVEEAAAGMLSGPDNRMDEELHAMHQMQAEQAQQQQGAAAQVAAQTGAPGQPDGTSGTAGNSSGSGSGGLLGTLTAWLHALTGLAATSLRRLESAFFNTCRQILEATPAQHWRMRLLSALATSRLMRRPLLSFYASTSDHTRRLVSVRANAKFASPTAGPEHPLNSGGGDLAAVVAALKKEHGLSYVFAWHAMFGFWGGVGLEEPEMQQYKPSLVLPTPTPGMLVVDPAVAWVQPVLSGVGLPEDPCVLHDNMHAYLASCGIDGVKVDVQSTTGLLGSGSGQGGGPALSARYHASLEASARRHFPGNQLINCMCHSTENIYRMADTNLARVSDDFYPTNPATHQVHIAHCSYNSLFFGALVIPDWDMFHSQHDKALLHATARAISGGPVYVSDRPGHHDFSLLRRLVLPDGSVLRCRLPGRPTADCLFADVSRDGTTALKVWNANAYTSVVAAFNIQGSAFDRPRRRFHTHDEAPPALTAAVGPTDVPGLAGAAEQFAAYVDSSQELRLLGAGDSVAVALPGSGGSDMVTLSPVVEAGGVLFAPIGLTSLLNGGGAVLSCSLSGGHSDDGFEVQPARAALSLRGAGAPGTLLCYASHQPMAVSLGGQQVPFTYDEAQAALRFELAAVTAGVTAGDSVDCVIQF